MFDNPLSRLPNAETNVVSHVLQINCILCIHIWVSSFSIAFHHAHAFLLASTSRLRTRNRKSLSASENNAIEGKCEVPGIDTTFEAASCLKPQFDLAKDTLPARAI